ncbi:hypothetical protein FHS23_003610 [Prauserella isguenensis]|uniref:Uncharacterized protein n=1 Tax=Prauserella isguenensis TaxID=1470180 RepID=A0A839S499_9PSEU|nr:hypothetical protein [Prauserella isguenensis]
MVATESAGTHAVNGRDTAVPRGVHRDDLTSGVGDLAAVEQLLDRADTMEWRAPELAAILGERAASLAEAAGANALWVRAEATVVHAHVLLGHRASTVGRAVAALRAAEDAELPVIAAQVRTDLAVCARSVGAPLTGLAILRPVLTVSGLSTVRRATALCHLVGCLGTLGRKAELDRVLLEGDRLVAGDATLHDDDKLMARGMIRLGVSAHRRRHGDTMGAADAARTGIGFLDRMADPSRDGGVARVRLVLELVCSLLDRGDGEPALEAAQPLFDEPERAAAVAPTAWLRTALATRALLTNGVAESAATMLRDALYSVVRHDLDAVVSRLWLELANVEERIGNPSEAVTCLHNARAAEQRYARARSQARAVLHGEFGSGEQAPVDLAEIVTSARPQQTAQAAAETTAVNGAVRHTGVPSAGGERSAPADFAPANFAPANGASGRRAAAAAPAGVNGSALANGHSPINGHGAAMRNGAAVAGSAASGADTDRAHANAPGPAADEETPTTEPAEGAAESTMVMPVIPRFDEQASTRSAAAKASARAEAGGSAIDGASAAAGHAAAEPVTTEAGATAPAAEEPSTYERFASEPTASEPAAAGPTVSAPTVSSHSVSAPRMSVPPASEPPVAEPVGPASVAEAGASVDENSSGHDSAASEQSGSRKRRRHDVEHGSVTARSVLDRLGISPSRSGGRRHASGPDSTDTGGTSEAASQPVSSGEPASPESSPTEPASPDVLDSGTAGASVEPILAAATASAPQNDATAILPAVNDDIRDPSAAQVDTAGSGRDRSADDSDAPVGESVADPWLPRVKLPPPLLPVDGFTADGDPVGGHTRAAEPGPTAPEPAASEPAVSEPATPEPAVGDTGAAEFAPADSAGTRSAPSVSAPEPAESEPAEAAPSYAEPADVQSADAQPAGGVPDLPRHELPLDEPPEDAGLAELLARALAEHQVASGAALASTPGGHDRENHTVGSGAGVNGSRRNGSAHAHTRGRRHDR